MISSVVRPLCRKALARAGPSNMVRQAHQPAKSATCPMDLLPIPEGSWETHYKQNNAKYNMHLLIGVVTFGVTLGFGFLNGLLYGNTSLPELPKKK